MDKKKHYKKRYDVKFPSGWWWGILTIILILTHENNPNNISVLPVIFSITIFTISGFIRKVYVG